MKFLFCDLRSFLICLQILETKQVSNMFFICLKVLKKKNKKQKTECMANDFSDYIHLLKSLFPIIINFSLFALISGTQNPL